ncbi:MAG: hypothetical protein RL264_1292 [Bacteroidota bacterium]|jgi:hypothetical protein
MKLLKILLVKPFITIVFFFCLSCVGHTQTTLVSGKVTDALSGTPMPFVKVQFLDTKIGTFTDSLGNYSIESYYASDTLQFTFSGYLRERIFIQKGKTQTVNVVMKVLSVDLEEIVIKAPDELPSVRLHKRVVANKDINNKEKLESFQYESYNKIQFDLNNISEKFSKNGLVKRLDVIMNYLDTAENGKSYLPVLLSETKSNYYFKNHPKQKKEVIKGTRVTGIEHLQINQFLGDMYLDINVYDNVYSIFYKSFISPVAPYARNYYKFYLDDSTFIDKYWCYKLRFVPKRTGDLTFSGEMWIHDTTYAIKQISATISPDVNLNYIQDFYFEQRFEQVEKEVWMMVKEDIIADVKLTENSKLYGFFARKTGVRRNYKINQEYPNEFFMNDNTVEFEEGAKNRDENFWQEERPIVLNLQEKEIQQMIDSLNEQPMFKFMKGALYMATTGYWKVKKLEIGDIYSLVSVNPVERLRLGFALRTSNNFSKRIELGGRVAYGFLDDKLKYGAKIRYNITPKKRGMLTIYYSYNIEQIGQSSSALSMGNTFTTVLSTAAFDKLTFVTKGGLSLEKDIKKDFILFTGAEWRELLPLGLANYRNVNANGDTTSISSIRTTEFTVRMRWAKDEEFLSGYFDRSRVTCTNPILSLQFMAGVKGILGSQYNYQKLEFQFEHYRQIGGLGWIYYGSTLGYIFGDAPYPLLKVHEGNQSYYRMYSAYNKMNFIEFVSDKYVSAFVENKWGGLFFDRIPYVKKLKLRLVTDARILLGSISQRHESEMLIPTFVKRFNGIPYAEVSVGIENILKVIRIDLVWRATHLDPGMNPFGVRGSLVFNF